MGIDSIMYVKLRREVTDKEVLRLSYDLGSKFGHSRFFFDRTGKVFSSGPRHIISRVGRLFLDDDDIPVEPERTYLEVGLGTRYYGEGYERGDLPFLLLLGAYLERRLPGCELWYGGDSGGVLFHRFDAARRGELFDHFVHRDDNNYAKTFSTAVGEGLSRHCDFCDEPMIQSGAGPEFAAFYCPGCGFSEETRDGGRTWAAGGKL